MIGPKRFPRSVRNAGIITRGFLCQRLRRYSKNRILAFHDVSDRRVFLDRILWLKNNFNILSIKQILGQPKTVSDKLNIAITFDDGYENWIHNALPILIEKNVPATFFVSSGVFRGSEQDRQEFVRINFNRSQPLQPLSRRGLRTISEHTLFTVGGHTATHRSLGNIYCHDSLKKLVIDDKHWIEDFCGFAIDYFAYPRGRMVDINATVVEFLSSTTYQNSFTILPGGLFEKNHPHLLSRDCLEFRDSTSVWNYWLKGGRNRIPRIMVNQ